MTRRIDGRWSKRGGCARTTESLHTFGCDQHRYSVSTQILNQKNRRKKPRSFYLLILPEKKLEVPEQVYCTVLDMRSRRR